MGRYYTGDIEGKFWFGTQSSNAADRFGYTGQTPNYLEYNFSKGEYDTVRRELIHIRRDNLGHWYAKLEEFFKKNNSYNDSMLVEAGFPKEKIGFLLQEYADYELGLKIKKCIEDTGQCCFEAEL